MTYSEEEDDEGAFNVTVPQGTPEQRLDKMLANLCSDLSRSRIKAIILDGEVVVNGSVLTSPSAKIEEGDELSLNLPAPVDDTPLPQDIPLDIVYEDDDLLVINKPAGLVVHPGAGNPDGTLVNAVLFHCGDSLSGIGGVRRPGIVHRLDKETSGLIIVAKNDQAHHGLSEQLSDRSLSRTYVAFVWKVPVPLKGIVDQPIGRHATNRLKMGIRLNSGREAVTHYHMLEAYGEIAAMVECKLETGRTHQIRVHMAHIRHPLIGDPLYGLPMQEVTGLLNKGGYETAAKQSIQVFPRQALHAREISFIHPVSGEEMSFEAPWPEDMLALKNHLESIR